MPMLRTINAALILLASLASAAATQAGNCGDCDTQCKSCRQCDDKGLLDTLDAFAGKLHSSLHQHIRKPKSCACKAAKNAPQARTCNTQPTCDHRPAHTHAQPAPSCGCEQHQRTTQPIFETDPNNFSNSVPGAPMIPVPLIRGSTEPGKSPIESTPLQPIPTPDSKLNPFLDDADGQIRRVPAQPIQLKRDVKAYRESFDPQAYNRYRVRLGDEVAVPASASLQAESENSMITSPGVPASSRRAFDGATRRNNAAGQPMSANRSQPVPGVITASSIVPAAKPRPVGSTRIGDLQASPAKPLPVNPLR